MKNLFFIILALHCFGFYAIDEVRPERNAFDIVSDTFDKKVPKGKCLIEGTIYDNGTGVKLEKVTVLSGKKTVQSDKMGYFRLVQQLAVKHVKFSKLGFTDCYIENYEFKSQHHIIVRIYIKNELEEHHYEVKKPVIYAYSDKDLAFEFILKPFGNFTFSYPPVFEREVKVNQSWQKEYVWNMSLKNDSLIDERTGNVYPYLFWESFQYDVSYITNASDDVRGGSKYYREIYHGQIVSRNDLMEFFDTTLTNLNFNAQEKTDFITFWAPQMKKHDYYLIQFLQDDYCVQLASYQIEPKPDKLNRLYMLFSGFDQHIPNVLTIPQKLKAMEREGFYLVDWGGVELPFEESINFDDKE